MVLTRSGRSQVLDELSDLLDLVLESVANIADRLGCGACCSGFDIFFDQERRFLLGNEAAPLRKSIIDSNWSPSWFWNST